MSIAIEQKTDEEVAIAVQNGDSEAFSVLMRRYAPRLLAYAKTFLHDYDNAEDVVEETFIHAFRKIRLFDPGRKFLSWIYRIAHNEAVNAIIKAKHERVAGDWDEFLMLESPEHAEDAAERDEMRDLVQASLQKLPVKYREPLVLYYLQEMEYKEIAAILKAPISTVGVRIRRGKKLLRDIYIKTTHASSPGRS